MDKEQTYQEQESLNLEQPRQQQSESKFFQNALIGASIGLLAGLVFKTKVWVFMLGGFIAGGTIGENYRLIKKRASTNMSNQFVRK